MGSSHDGAQTSTQRRTYVLDTSVLLADPAALRRFEEHEVVLPVVVITELEGKRHHPELGYFARSALRMLDELRVSAGRLDQPVAITHAGDSRLYVFRAGELIAATQDHSKVQQMIDAVLEGLDVERRIRRRRIRCPVRRARRASKRKGGVHQSDSA